MKREVILFFFGCSEVNSTWLITSELANQHVWKALFTWVVYTKNSCFKCVFIVLNTKINVAMHLFSNKSQMMSKCGKIKKSRTESISPVCHWCSYHILTSSVMCYWTDVRQYEIYFFYVIKKQTTTDKAFYFKIVQQNSKTCLWWTWKKPFGVIHL